MRDLPFNKVLHVHFYQITGTNGFLQKHQRNKKERNQILSDKAKNTFQIKIKL